MTDDTDLHLDDTPEDDAAEPADELSPDVRNDPVLEENQ